MEVDALEEIKFSPASYPPTENLFFVLSKLRKKQISQILVRIMDPLIQTT
jgi:hypothetical protein